MKPLLTSFAFKIILSRVATAPTVYGIETETANISSFTFEVATAPTVYGIETKEDCASVYKMLALQQHLPFTVLKLQYAANRKARYTCVATAPTVYGIETLYILCPKLDSSKRVATAPTVYGIETL